MHIIHIRIHINGISSGVTDFRENLAANLRSRRGKLTQTAFARKAGITQASINRIEQGRQNVTIDTLQRLCERLKCTAGDLLDQRKNR